MPEVAFVGPRVPEHIQKLRNERRKTRDEKGIDLPQEAAQGDDDNAVAVFTGPLPAEPQESSATESSDDDGFGPQIPTASAEDEEQAALERLQARTVAAPELESNLGSDRSNWLASALGASGNGEDISYNPKSFRRNAPLKMDKSWTETQEERSKREAQDMMGLSAKKAKTDSKPSSTPQDAPEVTKPAPGGNQASLLEEHRQRRLAEKEIEDNSHEKNFDWERDMKGAGRGASDERVQKFANLDRFTPARK